MPYNIPNRVKWETFKGEEYLSIDYSNLNDREFLNVVMQAKKQMENVRNRSVKLMSNLTNFEVSFTTFQTVMTLTAEEKDKIAKFAIINNIQSNSSFLTEYLKVFGFEKITFPDKESALEYLMNED